MWLELVVPRLTVNLLKPAGTWHGPNAYSQFRLCSLLCLLSSVVQCHWYPRQVNIMGQHGRNGNGPKKVDQLKKLFVVAAMPCTAKKDDIAQAEIDDFKSFLMTSSPSRETRQS